MLWLEKTLPSGAKYGYGEYKKTIAQLAKAHDAYKGFVSQWPQWLQGAASLAQQYGEKLLQAQLSKLDEYTKLPTYYVFYKTPDGAKSIGGEWNIMTGGSSAMKAYFSQVFEPRIKEVDGSDWGSIALCVQAVQMSAKAPQQWSPDISRLKKDLDVSSGDSSFVLPLAIGGGLLLFILLRR